MSPTLSAFTSLGVYGYPIPERSEATPGLFNQIFSGLSANLDRLNSDVSSIVGSSVGTTESVLGFSSNTLRAESGNTILLAVGAQSIVGRWAPSYTSSYNALWFGSAASSNASRVQEAINSALNSNVSSVWVPQVLLPYNASLVTFSPVVKMLREGGNPQVFDMAAYGWSSGDRTVGATPSFNAATAAAQVAGVGGIKGGTVFFPAGQYYFLTTPSALTGTLNITYQGEGHDCSALALGAAGVSIFNLGGGGSVACTRVTIKDLWVGAFENYATGYGLQAVTTGYPLTPTSELLVDNVKFENLPNPIYLDNTAAAIFRGCRVQQSRLSAVVGHMVYMIRSVSQVWDSNSIACYTGTLPGDAMRIDSDCDTILCWKCEHVLLGNGASTNGFHIMDSVGAGTHPPRIIRLSDCEAENGQVGFLVDAARDCRIRGGECANNNAQGVLITGGISVEVAGVQSFLNNTHGIHAQGGSAIDIHDCTAANNSQAANNVSDGIVVQTSDVRCVNNRSGDVFFTNPNKQRYGLNITAGTDNLVIGGNKLQGNLGSGFEQPMTVASTGTNVTFLGTAFLATSPAVLASGYDAQGVGQAMLQATLTGALAVAAPSNSVRGQRITFSFIQDGTGGRVVTWNAVFKQTWSDAGNTLNKRTAISFIYDGTNWNQDGAQTPYV